MKSSPKIIYVQIVRLVIAISCFLWFILMLKDDSMYADLLEKYIFVPVLICFFNLLIDKALPSNICSKIARFLSMIPFVLWMFIMLLIKMILMFHFLCALAYNVSLAKNISDVISAIININRELFIGKAMIQIIICLRLIFIFRKKRSINLYSKIIILALIKK